jgi:hypothetical protein
VAALLLLLIFVGFARTFYLRSYFQSESLATHLHLHGAVLTLWFVLLFTQTLLVGRGQIQRHRQLGVAGVVVAAAAVVTGLQTNTGLLHAMRSEGDFGPNSLEVIIILGNYLTLVAFALLVGAAVLLRRHAQSHKRLMLLAGIAIIGPALGRIPRFSFLHAGPTAPRDYAIGGLLLLITALFAFDLRSLRRIHPASYIGGLGILIALAVAVALALAGPGFAILQAL